MEAYFSILQMVAALLISPASPPKSNQWEQLRNWEKVPQGLEFVAKSNELPKICQANPDASIRSPIVTQGAHYFYSGDRLIYSSTDIGYSIGTSMNSSASVRCDLVDPYLPLIWKVVGTTGSYAVITQFPYVTNDTDVGLLFSHSVPSSASGILIVVGVISTILFSGKGIGSKKLLYYCMANISLGIHFALTTPDLYGIRLSPFHLHRLHDIFLWIGMIWMWGLFFELKMIPKYLQIAETLVMLLSVFIIISARNLDQAQVGSTIAFIVNILLLTLIMIKFCISYFSSTFRVLGSLQTIAILIYGISGINDLLTHMGLIHTFATYPIGTVAVMIFMTFLVNLEIIAVYKEHDALSLDLRTKVQEKTKHLEEANRNLREMKADAIESAKLVSIGTLATGIAHEINNSLNYVGGAFSPLKALILKYDTEEKDKKKVEGLFKLIDEGMDMTIEIIKSLKIYASTSTNQLEAVQLSQIVKGSIAILRSKIGDIDVKIDIPEGHDVIGKKVALSQVFVNLISNAADALSSSNATFKQITISTEILTGYTLVKVGDNGIGMTNETIDRIFEPFFTTKDVGIGTGLGLHIARKEMNAMGGTLEVESTIEKGTTFTLILRNEIIGDKSA